MNQKKPTISPPPPPAPERGNAPGASALPKDRYQTVTWFEAKAGGYVMHLAQVPESVLRQLTLKSYPEDIQPIVISKAMLVAEESIRKLRDGNG